MIGRGLDGKIKISNGETYSISNWNIVLKNGYLLIEAYGCRMKHQTSGIEEMVCFEIDLANEKLDEVGDNPC